jgi:hypothetical protein
MNGLVNNFEVMVTVTEIHIVPRLFKTLSGVIGKSRIHFHMALYMAPAVRADVAAPTFSPMPQEP